MKLAIIHPNFNTQAGAENVVYWLCEDLAGKHGMEVTLFSVDFAAYEKRFKSIAGLGINKILVPKLCQRSKLLTLIFAVIYFKKNLKNYDVINPHNYPASLWVGIANILSRGKMPKIIWSCNEPAKYLYKKICSKNTPENLQVENSDLNRNMKIKITSRIKFAFKGLYKPILRYIDTKAIKTFYRVLAISDTSRDQVKEIYGLDNAFTCALGLKVMAKVDPAKINNDSNYFLTVSRLEGYKNIPKAIEAFALLKRQNKLANIKYYIVGAGPLEYYLKGLIAKYNLSEDVKLFGFVTKEELIEFYKNCLFIIHLPYDETFGLAYLEAAAFYKPSIASNQGGPKEIVVHNETGLLVEPAQAIEIAKAIEKLCQDKVGREKMGQQAYERLGVKYLWEKFVERYVNAVNSNS